MFSDLIAPQGRRPIFAQTYTLTPEAASALRTDDLSDVLKRVIRQEIITKLEALMRENPFGRTFVTAGERINAVTEKNNGELPHFQVTIYLNFMYC